MGLITGIHHVALKCTSKEQFEKTLAFYHEVLGMEFARTWGEGESAGAMLNTGAGIIEIFANGEQDLPQGAIRHFALATDDVDACVEAVKAAGYEITVQPGDIDIPSNPVFPIRMAFCIGPVGEEIEFFQEK